MTECWLAQFANDPCDGVTDLCHLIPKQLIKREVFGGFGGPLHSVSTISQVVWHPSLLVPGCRHHHAALDVGRTIKIPRNRLPAKTEAFAEAFELEWWLEREYGSKPQ